MLEKIKIKIRDFLSGDNLSVFLILFFFLLFSFLIILRLYNLQIVKGEYFRSKVVKISQEKQRNEVFDRGKIYFKNKDEFVPVAIQDIGCILIINNKDNLFYNNNNIQNVYEKINKITNINKKLFFKKAKSFANEYGWFKKQVSLEDWKKIKKMNIEGVNCVRQS
jgi:cell division protein FtsI/penicillin-binding protein 2